MLLMSMVLTFISRTNAQTPMLLDYPGTEMQYSNDNGYDFYFLFWNINRRFTSGPPNDTSGNFTCKWAAVRYDSLYDVNSQTGYAYAGATIRVDTIGLYINHQNVSGTPDTLTVSILQRANNTDGFTSSDGGITLTNTVLWNKRIITTTSLTPGVPSNQLGFYAIPCGFTLPVGVKFIIKVDYTGNTSDIFKLADFCRSDCGPPNSNSVAASLSVFPKNSWRYLNLFFPPSTNFNGTGNLTFNSPPYLQGCNLYYFQNFGVTALITATIPLSVNVIQPNVTACQGATVNLSGSASGGTPPYYYSWSNGQSGINQTSINVVVGSNSQTYRLTVTDAQSASVVKTFTVSPLPNTVVITENITNASSPTANDGSVNISVSGGNAPYSYQWSNGATSQNLTNIQTGTYTVTVTDANGCVKTGSYYVGYNSSCNQPVTISPSGTVTICTGNSATLTASNASTYLWSNGATTQSIVVYNGAIYSVTAVDANNCQSSASKTVVETTLNTNGIIGNTSVNTAQTYTYSVVNIPGNTYTWSIQGGTINSGQGTNSIIVSFSGSGPYSISVLESNSSCSQTLTLLINNNSCATNVNVVKLDNTPACNGETVRLVAQTSSSGALQWIKNGIVLGGQTNDTLIVSSQGTYQVRVTDGNCIVFSSGVFVQYSAQIPVPVISSATPSNLCPPIALIINNTYYGYSWSNGDTNPTTNALFPGSYTVTVYDNSGCDAVSVPFVINQLINTPTEICIVTVDNSTNNNKIIWQKINSSAIDSYIVYKEVNQNFVKIGSVKSNLQPIYSDMNSNPNQGSFRYKIAAKDTCGIIALQGSAHKTISLSISQNALGKWNLDWSSYEGFNINSYNIFRGTNSGNLTQIASVSGNVFNYTDTTSLKGILYYKIEAINVPSCANQHGYYSSNSNIADNGIFIGIDELSFKSKFKIYPNPTWNEFFIDVENLKEFDFAEMVLYDIQGKLISRKTLSDKQSKIFLSDNQSGMYLIKIITDKGELIRKIIKY
jgi:hypothetical protein